MGKTKKKRKQKEEDYEPIRQTIREFYGENEK